MKQKQNAQKVKASRSLITSSSQRHSEGDFTSLHFQICARSQVWGWENGYLRV